jgi:hypothetical protein
MPANSRLDLIQGLKVNVYTYNLHYQRQGVKLRKKEFLYCKEVNSSTFNQLCNMVRSAIQ